MQTRYIRGFGAMALGVVVVGWEVEVGSFARALFLFDVFDAAAAVACGLRGDAVVFAVGHDWVEALSRRGHHASLLEQ